MKRLRHKLTRKKHLTHKNLLYALYTASIFFSLHYALVLYLTSSYLGQYFSLSFVGVLYILSAAVSLSVAFSISHIYNKYSNYRVLLASLGVLFFTLLMLGGSPSVPQVIVLFILQQTLISIIFVSLSVAIGEVSRRSESGSVRGVYLTILSTGVLVAAFFSGVIFTQMGFAGIYLISALLLTPVAYLTYRFFHSIEEPEYKTFTLRESVKAIWKRKDVRRIVYIQFVLEVFFAVMVVYMTPFLAETSGIERGDILKYIMPIALLPFVIFPYELGILADKKYGEKELLISGLTIALVFTLLIPFVSSSSIVVWAIILFATRIGASIIEEMTSTYFYKKVADNEVETITLFGAGTRATALIVVPAIAFVLFSIFNLPTAYIFIVACLFLVSGIMVASKIRDTL